MEATTKKTVTATYHPGVLELKETLPFKDGDEVIVSIEPVSSLSEEEKRDLFLSAAGGWKDVVDEHFIEELYALRRVKTRPEVEPWQ